MKPRSQQLIGVLTNSGSLYLTGSLNASQGFTGSLQGSASYAITASYSINAISSSYAATASYAKDLRISGSITNVDFINFNTSSVVTQPVPGKLSWNDVDGTLDIGLKGGNVTLQIGQEEVLRVVNKTGANLLEADYHVVRVRSVAEGGAQGQRLAVVLAQGDNDANSATTLGIVTENINLNAEGYVTTSGKVRGINTTGTLQGETWVDGDMLYLSPTTPGRLTNIKPQAPQHMVIMGYVVYAHNSQGIIFVKVDNGYEIDELHNILINTGSLTSGQLLVRSGSVWINSRQLTGSYGLTGSLSATSFIGSLTGTASYALTASYLVGQSPTSSYSLTSSYSNNILGQPYYIPTFTGNNTLATSSIYQSGSYTAIRNSTGPEDPTNPDILYVSGEGVDTYNLISAHGDLDSYIQVNVQNYSSGSGASSDIVATADDGDETTGYIDMGINSSQYTASNFVGSAKDAYVYSTGNNLYIGNATPGKEIILFNGGLDAINNARLHIHDQGTIGINTNQYDISNPPSLQIQAPNSTTTNLVQITGETDNFIQVAISNTNGGGNASADLALYNDLDPNQLDGYIDMGINSTNYIPNVDYPGGAGDAYIFTSANHFHIGTINNQPLIFFTSGSGEDLETKLYLSPTNNHWMSGSFTVTQGVTSSLQGTASWAVNAVTASYAPLYLPLTGGTINGNVILNGTASIAYLNVLVESASIIYSSGSNQFGDATNDVQTLVGRVIISGSLEVTGSLNAAGGVTGSLLGTSSYALTALSSSFSSTASYVLQAVSASYATSASYAPVFPYSGSAIITGSLVLRGVDAGSTNAFLVQNNAQASIFTITNAGSGSFTGSFTVQGNSTNVQAADYYFTANGFGGDNVLKVSNGNGFTAAGVTISRTAFSNGRNALTIIGGGTTGLSITSAGTITFNNNVSTWSDTDGNYIQSTTSPTHGAGVAGMLYNTLGGGATSSHIFRKGRSLVSTGTGAIIHLYANYTEDSTNSNNTPMLKIAPVYNLTGTGVRNMIGIDYDPTVTAITGSHYGILIRTGLSGFGMGSSMPSASVHVRASNTGSVFIAESLTSSSLFTVNNNGSSSFAGSLTVTGSVALGDATAPAVYTSVKTSVSSGSTTIYNMLTASYDGAFFDYVLKGGSGARAGNIMAIWSGSSVSYTDNSTSDIGNTSGFTFAVILSGSNMVLTSAVATNGWTLKTAVRTI